jgi:Flp pilus assembly protein TadG
VLDLMPASPTMDRQRGQVLPLWLFGSAAMLVCLFFLFSYAYTISWQVRAQNAADAAAQAVLALQTQQFNQMEVMLYTSAVEEYRTRRLLNGMLLAAHDQGGCGDDATCETVFQALRTSFLESTQRYTNDVIVTQRVTANMSFDTVKSDAQALINRLTSGSFCTNNTGGDCAFTYHIVDFSPRTAGLETVLMDALGYEVPTFDRRTAAAVINPALFAPARVEVAVCAQVPPLGPSFFGYTPKPFYAIGRAAATAVMVEQDWMQPGQVINPLTAGVFQPDEHYVSPPGIGAYDWYGVDFGGNSNEAYESYNVFAFELTSDEFSGQLGWWNSIPIPTYMGQQSTGSLGCGAAAGA